MGRVKIRPRATVGIPRESALQTSFHNQGLPKMVGKQGFWVIIRQYEGGKIRSVVGLICLVVVVVVVCNKTTIIEYNKIQEVLSI